jgi:hypothetical protein
MRQLVDGAFEPEASELLRLTGPRPEPGAPKQPLGLGGPERPSPDGDTSHAREIGSDQRRLDPDRVAPVDSLPVATS